MLFLLASNFIQYNNRRCMICFPLLKVIDCDIARILEDISGTDEDIHYETMNGMKCSVNTHMFLLIYNWMAYGWAWILIISLDIVGAPISPFSAVNTQYLLYTFVCLTIVYGLFAELTPLPLVNDILWQDISLKPILSNSSSSCPL